MKAAAICLGCAALAALPGLAASVDALVRDAKGTALEDAVVWVAPKSGNAPRPRREATIEQVDKRFVPLVTVVQAGTQVRFPNRDEVRHHVYSFSPAKPFEIKLYAGTPADPVLFDKAGEVVLGCNIHDHMIAYVLVVDSPWFAKAGKDGRVRIEGLPAGEYDVQAWHYGQASASPARVLRVRADETATAEFALALRPGSGRPPGTK